MLVFLTEIRETIVPDRKSEHGPLPPLLLLMTLVTGLVDAFSYLLLGHVFVANMTGNVVILGFALVGAHGFSVTACLAAIAAFAVGGALGGRMGARLGKHRGRHLSTAAVAQTVFLAAGTVLAALIGGTLTTGYHYALIGVLAVAMGIQNATVRKLAVPDLTTTVLTLTITGIAADSAIGGGKGSKAGRRLTAVCTMLAGAVVGAAFVVHGHVAYPLLIAAIMTLGVATAAATLGKSNARWVGADS
ncbi:MAG: YoaK family protein [Acidimicrobiales bacterium]